MSFIFLLVICSALLYTASTTDTDTEYEYEDDNSTVYIMDNWLYVCPQDRSLETLISDIKKNTTQRNITENSELSEEFLECPKIMLPSEYFCIIDNNNIYNFVYDTEHNNSQFYIHNETIFICSMILSVEESEDGVDHIAGILTIVGISISNICLAIHFVAFLLIREMRNLPGKNLASLTVAVFFSFLFFVIGQTASETRSAHLAFAIFTYYFFVSSFLWMNVVGFEIWRSLRMASNELRLNTKYTEMKRFVYYSIYAWFLPIVFISIILIIDNCDGVIEDFRPGLGERNSWFSKRKPLIIFFLTPLIIVMILNATFFIWSALIINKHTDRLKKDKNSKALIRKFSSYAKLAIITGLTWISAIIAFLVQNKEVWYVFIVLTTFYGFFIFISFTCTNKVFRYLKKRFPITNKWLPTSTSSTEIPDTEESKQ